MIIKNMAYWSALSLLCIFSRTLLCGLTIHNDTRKPVTVAFVRTIRSLFKVTDLHSQLYVAPDSKRQEVIDRTSVYVIPPGKYITAPSLGERSLGTYDRDLWVSYSYDNLVRSITEPAGRTPYKNQVFYYNIGSGKNPIHIVENNASKLSFVVESSGNKVKLKELGATVGMLYEDVRPLQYSLGDNPQPQEFFNNSQLSPEEEKELAKKFNRIMRLLAIPYRM